MSSQEAPQDAQKIARRFSLHQLIHWAAVGVMVPVLTLVLRELGLSLFEVGIAMAAYSITTVLLEVPSGALADLWGRRKTYLLGTAADMTSTVLFLMFHGLGFVVVAAALRGAGRAFASGSLEALAVENIRRQQPDFDLQRFFARVGMAIPAGLAATSMVGGFLPELASLPVLGAIAGVSPAGGFSINLMANAILIGTAGVLALTLFEERHEPGAVPAPGANNVPKTTPASGKSGARGTERRTARAAGAIVRQIGESIGFAFTRRNLALILSSSFAVGLVLNSVETFWQPRLASISATEGVRIFGVLGAAYFGVAVLASALSPSFVRLLRGNRAATIMLYRILSGTVLIGLAVQTSTAGFAVAYLGFFFLFCITGPVQSTMLNELVEDSRRSTLISASSLISQSGGFLGALLFGVISQGAGIGASWSIAGGAFMLSALLFLPLARRQRGSAELGVRA